MSERRDLARECHCVLCEPPDDQGSWDGAQREFATVVADRGWTVLAVDAVGSTPAWVFTLGLWHTFGHPDLAMFGLLRPDMEAWLDTMVEQVQAGEFLVPDEARSGVLPNHPVIARPIDPSWYEDLLWFAPWFGQRLPMPYLQLVWPDRYGHFPWDEEAGQRCRTHQPQSWIPMDEHATGHWTRLSAPASWPFADGPETQVITTKRVILEDRPVTYVIHEPEGGWQFLDGEDVTVDDGTMVHMDHIVDAHPRVREVADLPRGWEAEYEPPDGAWVRQECPPYYWLDS